MGGKELQHWKQGMMRTLLILSGFLSRSTNVEERRPDQEDSGLIQRLSTGSSPEVKYQIILTTCCLLPLASLEPGYQWDWVVAETQVTVAQGDCRGMGMLVLLRCLFF